MKTVHAKRSLVKDLLRLFFYMFLICLLGFLNSMVASGQNMVQKSQVAEELRRIPCYTVVELERIPYFNDYFIRCTRLHSNEKTKAFNELMRPLAESTLEIEDWMLENWLPDIEPGRAEQKPVYPVVAEKDFRMPTREELEDLVKPDPEPDFPFELWMTVRKGF